MIAYKTTSHCWFGAQVDVQHGGATVFHHQVRAVGGWNESFPAAVVVVVVMHFWPWNDWFFVDNVRVVKCWVLVRCGPDTLRLGVGSPTCRKVKSSEKDAVVMGF